MKKMIKLATLCMALVLSFGLSVFTACNNNGNNSSPAESSSPSSSESSSTGENDNVTAYSFKLVDANGAALNGYAIQLCKGTDACFRPSYTDASGMASYNFPNATQDAYDIHVWNADMTQEYNYNGDHTTPAEYDGTTIVLTLGSAK